MMERHSHYRPILLILFWAVGLVVFYTLFYRLGWINGVPKEDSLLYWDAGWYNALKEKGYEFKQGQACNAGFFPLFAWFWKLTNLSPSGISLLNLLIAFLGIVLLARLYIPETSDLALAFTMPSMFFLYIPYSEALFFLFSSLVLWGVVKKQNLATVAGLFLASMTRPTMFFLLPALLLMELLQFDKRESWSEILKRIALVYLLPCMAGQAVVVIVQWMETGVWLAYFKVQSDEWGRQFSFPVLPFGTPNGIVPLWLDTIAFWVALLGLFCLAYLIFQKFWQQRIPDKSLVFSLAYIVLASFSIFFFNPDWVIGRTILNGLNRYIFVNPFFVVFCLWLLRNKLPLKMELLLVLVLAVATMILVRADEIHWHPAMYLLSVPAYLLLLFWYKRSRSVLSFFLAIIVNVALQAFYLGAFVSNWWVG